MTAALPFLPEYKASLVTEASTPKARILIAEDNPSNQLVATYMLDSLGYDSEVVPTGADAVEILSRESFDLVLMDCQMPKWTGSRQPRKFEKSKVEADRESQSSR